MTTRTRTTILAFSMLLAAPRGGRTEAFSYMDYGRVLRKHVNAAGLVNYGALKKARAKNFDPFLRRLAKISRKDFRRWPKQERIAFWINAYNALTIAVVLDAHPIRSSWYRRLLYPRNSIRQIPGAWDKLKHEVMGRKITLDHIEHKILRKKFREPRIHVALVCASRGCPVLRTTPYTGSRLDEQLHEQGKNLVKDRSRFRIDKATGSVSLNKIFDWYGKDFIRFYRSRGPVRRHSRKIRASLNYLAQYLTEAEGRYLAGKAYDVDFLDYDWSLNEQ